MLAHELRPPKGSKHARKRVGRGNASGHGSYSGKGMKGQKARAGRKPRLGFEGGQNPLIKRMPYKRGFINPFRVEYALVNLKVLSRFPAESLVTPEVLHEASLIKDKRRPVKVLGYGEIERPLTVAAHKFSRQAKEKIEAAGGRCQEIEEGPKAQVGRAASGGPKARVG